MKSFIYAMLICASFYLFETGDLNHCYLAMGIVLGGCLADIVRVFQS